MRKKLAAIMGGMLIVASVFPVAAAVVVEIYEKVKKKTSHVDDNDITADNEI